MRPYDPAAGAGVDDLGDLDARGGEVRGRGVARGVRGDHDGAVTGPDGVQVRQPACGAGEHDAGQVVAAEHVRALDQPGGHDERLRPRLDQSLVDARQVPLHDRNPVVVVAREGDRVGEHLDRRLRGDLGDELAQRRELGRVAAEAEVAAEAVLLVDEQHLGPGASGGDGRRQPGRSAADHEDVGVGVALVVHRLRGVRRDLARVHELPEHLLVGRPQTLRLDERLVVEAGREEAPGQTVDGLQVELQRRPRVLRTDLHAVTHELVRSADVRLVTDLDQAPRVEPVGRDQAARPVVLVAAGEHPHAGRGQRGDDRVAGVRAVCLAVPAEPQRATPVDHLAVAAGQPVGLGRWVVGRAPTPGLQERHAVASPVRTSLVRVSRSAVKYRLHPAWWYQVSVSHPRGLGWV